MIGLDSPRWSQLRHAYGEAGDVPAQLARLAGGDGRAIDELFGSICHQGSVYSASYAALPHLVEIAQAAADAKLQTKTLILIGAIVASNDRAPMSEELSAAYLAALPRALTLTVNALREQRDPVEGVYLLAAAASLGGRERLGRILIGFADKEFSAECPGCGCELYLWPDADGLTAAAEDPVSAPDTRRTRIVPGPEPAHETEYRWLTQLPAATASPLIGCRLPSLFGTGTCPACGDVFSVMEQLADVFG